MPGSLGGERFLGDIIYFSSNVIIVSVRRKKAGEVLGEQKVRKKSTIESTSEPGTFMDDHFSDDHLAS